MSSPINLGGQQLSFVYRGNAKARDFNRLLRDIIPTGIYSGGLIIPQSTNYVRIPIYTLVVNSNDGVVGDILVKVTSTQQYDFQVFTSTPPADGEYILYGLFTWGETPNNFLGFNFRTLASSEVTNEIRFGTFIISGGVITKCTPNRRHIGVFVDLQKVLERLMGSNTWSYSESTGAGTVNFPQYLILSNGTNRIRQNITWGAISGVSVKRPDVIVYEISWDSGTTYVTYATKTYTYSSDILTGIAWS